MKILAFDSASVSASCAVLDGEALLSLSLVNNGLTHSQTLMPQIHTVLTQSRLTLSELDGIAVTAGPGSFTGLRIGIATAKGLAWAAQKPVCGVSSLEAAAWGAVLYGGLICAVMDARREQVYNALFEARNGTLHRLTEDRAISLKELWEELRGKPAVLVGDGAAMCYQAAHWEGLCLTPVVSRYPTAFGVAMAARPHSFGPAKDLTPHYLRVSQAERLLMEKQKLLHEEE